MKKHLSSFLRALSIFWALALASGQALPAQDQEGDIREIEKLLNIKVSTAATYDQLSREAPASVTIMTSEDIARFGFRTLDEVFMAVPGFYTSYDRNYAYLGSRGFSRPTDYNDRILLLLNGHTINESMYGMAPVGGDLAIDMESVERIEIVRGPHSAIYGTGAMFSVINVITKTGNILDGLRLAAEAGSFGRKKGAAVFGKKLNDGTDLLISGQVTDIKGEDLYFREYDSPETNNGWARGLDWEKSYGFQATLARGEWSFQALVMSRDKGIPTGAWGISYSDNRAKTRDAWQFFEARYEHPLAGHKTLFLRGYLNRYAYKGWYPYEVMSWDSTTSFWGGGDLRLQWDVRPNNRLVAGAEFVSHLRADYRIWDEGGDQFYGDFPYRVFSLYIQDEIQVRRNLALTLGLRRDQYSTVGSSTTPRAALVFHPMRAGTLKLLYGQAFRAPNPYEVKYEDDELGYKGNPGLKPEKIGTFEIIGEYQFSGHAVGSISYYDYRLIDLIDQQMDPVDSFLQFRNLGRVKANGLEAGLTARWENGVRLQASYTYQDARNATTGGRLSNSPSHLIKGGLVLPLFKRLHLSSLFLHETERLTVYGMKTKPYSLLNLNLDSGRMFGHWEFSLLVRNAFDARYELPGGFEHLQPSLVQPSRNIAIRIAYDF